ncbi:MAG: RES domain-containing protein [Deltaproteobacteria bacterium]|nr:RES domain-containing protein [Deltaproteobacteria bacterium]
MLESRSMSRRRDIDSLVEQVQQQITHCITCQPYEGGEAVWIFGSRTDIDDVLDSCSVPERLKDEVLSQINCPGCGASIERPCDVGIKHDFEIEYDETLERAERRYESKLYDFSHFLQRVPYLGANHPLGKAILRTIKKFPKRSVERRSWFRGRRVVDGRSISTDDLRPPDPEQIAIPEGRFNHYGQAYWYLASTAEAASAEVVRAGWKMAWIQEWSIDHLDGVLDLRPWSPDDDGAFDDDGRPKEVPLLAVAMIFGDQITSMPARSEGWKPEYLVPRFLADAAKLNDFSAILFKSPRHYDENLVVFDRNAEFEPVGAPRKVELPEYLDKKREGIFFYQGFPTL